jgi:cytosine deaminase
VILQATDVVDALRLKPARLAVVRRGKVISTTPAVKYDLALGGQQTQTDLTSKDLVWR